MTTETRSELAMVPAQVKVVQHVRQVYACRHCERHELQTPIITAPMPKPVYPGSLASPSAMAYTMCQKYVDSMPLYRQEQQFARMGYTLSRQTMANWMIYGAEKWLTLIVEGMKDYLLKQEVLHADETTLQVLKEPGKSAETTSYLWIKPFVIGRKNWLFANTPRGATASATIYSVIETAKENGLHPFRYLQYLFEKLLQLSDIHEPKALEPFMPWSTSLPNTCRVP
ncbi:hypothetical protein BRIN106911_14175 [Brevibacillus invocatus]